MRVCIPKIALSERLDEQLYSYNIFTISNWFTVFSAPQAFRNWSMLPAPSSTLSSIPCEASVWRRRSWRMLPPMPFPRWLLFTASCGISPVSLSMSPYPTTFSYSITTEKQKVSFTASMDSMEFCQDGIKSQNTFISSRFSKDRRCTSRVFWHVALSFGIR